MFGSSFSGHWFLPDGWQEYLCALFAAACVVGEPANQDTTQAIDPQPSVATVQPQEPAPPKAQPSSPTPASNPAPEAAPRTSPPSSPSQDANAGLPESNRSSSPSPVPASGPAPAAKPPVSVAAKEPGPVETAPASQSDTVKPQPVAEKTPQAPIDEQTADASATSQPKAVSVQIEATPSVIEKGGSVQLSWQSENATNCEASGAWARARATSGSLTIKSLRKSAEYRLSCSGIGAAGAMARAQVRVRETKPVNLSFRVSPASVKPGESAELVWDAQHADACIAEGDWQGEHDATGRFDTGALQQDATFSIRCRNLADEEVSVVRVRVNTERFKLSWQAPGQNVDGSRAQDISGYRIYWGQRRGSYSGSTTIHSADTTEWEPDLSPGVYYFAISAFDSLGNESEKSEPLRAKI